MRQLLLCSLVLAGCAAERPLLLTRVPASDPYATPPLSDFPEVTRIHAPRVEGWSDDRHRAEVAALSTLVQASFPRAHADVTLLTGPAPATERVAEYLCDRARFRDARLHLVARRARWDADAWSFESLQPGDGAVWTLVSLEDAEALAAGADWYQALELQDGEEQRAACRESAAYLAACAASASDDGRRMELDPIIDVVHTGDEVTARAWLVDGGASLRLEWTQTSARHDDGAPTILDVRNASGHTGLWVELPRVSRDAVSGRFTLRDDEALVLVQAPPGRDDLLVTVVVWTRG
jgi:hypothetical protein